MCDNQRLQAIQHLHKQYSTTEQILDRALWLHILSADDRRHEQKKLIWWRQMALGWLSTPRSEAAVRSHTRAAIQNFDRYCERLHGTLLGKEDCIPHEQRIQTLSAKVRAYLEQNAQGRTALNQAVEHIDWLERLFMLHVWQALDSAEPEQQRLKSADKIVAYYHHYLRTLFMPLIDKLLASQSDVEP